MHNKALHFSVITALHKKQEFAGIGVLIGHIGPDALVVYRAVRQLHNYYKTGYHVLDDFSDVESALALLVVNVC